MVIVCQGDNINNFNRQINIINIKYMYRGLNIFIEIHIKITIYISNVPFMLTKHNLWKYFHLFQERTASIYLPNKKIPLFPTKLSELCSLSSGQERSSFSFSLYIDKETHQICHHEFQCEDITISTNYVYESADLLSNANYIQLLQTVQTTFNKNIQQSD